MDFDKFWTLVKEHGNVAYYHKSECEDLWSTLSPEKQQAVYEAIHEKLTSGKFVHYNPAIAIRDNQPKMQIISGDEYYRRYQTQANQDGWVRKFIPEQQKTIYVKQ